MRKHFSCIRITCFGHTTVFYMMHKRSFGCLFSALRSPNRLIRRYTLGRPLRPQKALTCLFISFFAPSTEPALCLCCIYLLRPSYLLPSLPLSVYCMSRCRPRFTSHHNRIHLSQGLDKEQWEGLK